MSKCYGISWRAIFQMETLIREPNDSVKTLNYNDVSMVVCNNYSEIQQRINPGGKASVHRYHGRMHCLLMDHMDIRSYNRVKKRGRLVRFNIHESHGMHRKHCLIDTKLISLPNWVSVFSDTNVLWCFKQSTPLRSRIS